MTVADRIIIPLDVPTAEDALALVDCLPEASFFKVGLELFVAEGPGLIARIKDRGKRVFLDLKFHDIPNTMAGACRSAARHGVDLLTVHGCATRRGLEAAQSAAEAGAAAAGVAPPTLLAVTVLTSVSPGELAEDVRVSLPVADYVAHLATQAQASGIGGAVCSPQEITTLRSHCGPDFTLVTPGVRPDWSEKGDQSRVLTPQEAFAAGSSYLVIGRPITQAPDPAAAFARVVQDCQG